METTRRKRIKRSRAPYGWQEVPADLAILSLLTRYPFLRGAALYGLLDTQGYGYEAVKKRLRILFDHGLVDKVSNLGPKTRPNYNASDVYRISRQGQQRLNELPTATTNLHALDTERPAKEFKHSMMICDALVSIEVGVAQTGCTFLSQGDIFNRLANQPEHLALPYHIQWSWDGRTEKRESAINPDGIFGIEYPDGKSRLFLLEAEHWSPTTRTTLKNSSTFRKVLAYRSIKATKTKVYGKSNFNVLFVFPTADRTYNAREMVKDTFGEEPTFLFQTQPVMEQELRDVKPNPELFTGVWLRPGLPDVSISEPV